MNMLVHTLRKLDQAAQRVREEADAAALREADALFRAREQRSVFCPLNAHRSKERTLEDLLRSQIDPSF